jgi:hypothetical protein
MKQTLKPLVFILLAVALGACSRNVPTAPSGVDPAALQQLAANAAESHSAESHSRARVFTASGDITPGVNAFRDSLGTLNANTPGSQPGGRREINWDAVPAQFTNTNDFPADFFNQPVAGRARGTVFSTPGTGFRTSDNNFADVKPDFDGQFNFFSPIRTFMPVGSSRMTVNFFVPGSAVAATSRGFGVVFSDVDRVGSASIRVFDANGRSLGRYFAPAAPNGLSFVGVTFSSAVVASVEIRSGEAAVVTNVPGLAALVARSERSHGDDKDDKGDDDDDHGHRRNPDLVIMDDFIYGEPTATTGGLSAPVASSTGGSLLR